MIVPSVSLCNKTINLKKLHVWHLVWTKHDLLIPYRWKKVMRITYGWSAIPPFPMQFGFIFSLILRSRSCRLHHIVAISRNFSSFACAVLTEQRLNRVHVVSRLFGCTDRCGNEAWSLTSGDNRRGMMNRLSNYLHLMIAPLPLAPSLFLSGQKIREPWLLLAAGFEQESTQVGSIYLNFFLTRFISWDSISLHWEATTARVNDSK